MDGFVGTCSKRWAILKFLSLVLCSILLLSFFQFNFGSGQIQTVNSSPLKQFKSGIMIKDIKCKQGFVLAIKKSDNSPACVKPDTAQKLVERGWGTIVTSPTSCPPGQTMVNGQCITSIPINPASKCSTGYGVIQISAGSYLCQPTNPPPLSNPTSYPVGQRV